MSCPPEKLYQLEFVVKSVTRCRRPDEEGCGTAVTVRFLDHPEQTVCEIPPCAGGRSDTTVATVIPVNKGKAFTFPKPSGGGACCPMPFRVSVHLYRLMGANTLPGRKELGSGEMNASHVMSADGRCRSPPPSNGCAEDDDDDDDDDAEGLCSVPITDCKDGQTVAMITVRARTWCAGSVMAATIQGPRPPTPRLTPCPVPCPVPCCDTCGGSDVCARPPPSSDACCRKKATPTDACCSKKVTLPAADACCRKKLCCPNMPSSRACRSRPCGHSCCTAQRRNINATEFADERDPLRQYTSVGCEIDGRKIDLRVRKKNYETCAVQRQITSEAEAFASRVMTVIKDMHGLITDSVGARNMYQA